MWMCGLHVLVGGVGGRTGAWSGRRTGSGGLGRMSVLGRLLVFPCFPTAAYRLGLPRHAVKSLRRVTTCITESLSRSRSRIIIEFSLPELFACVYTLLMAASALCCG